MAEEFLESGPISLFTLDVTQCCHGNHALEFSNKIAI